MQEKIVFQININNFHHIFHSVGKNNHHTGKQVKEGYAFFPEYFTTKVL